MRQRMLVLGAILGAITVLVMGAPYGSSTFGVDCTKDCSENDGMCQGTDTTKLPGCVMMGGCPDKIHYSGLPHHHDLPSGSHGIADVDVYCMDINPGMQTPWPNSACSVGKTCVPNYNSPYCFSCYLGPTIQVDQPSCCWDDEGCGA
jgi:hypothetical protein